MANIAIIGSTSTGKTRLAESLGKKGTQSDITLYHFTKKDTLHSLIDAPGYPGALKPLITALNLADTAILCIPPGSIDAPTGECIIACDLMEITSGIIALTKADTTNPFQLEEMHKKIQQLTRGTSLKHWEVIPVSTTNYTGMDRLRETITRLDETIQQANSEKKDAPPRVHIDHAFNVTGIGCVVLGVVKEGTLHVKEKLTLYPPGRRVEIRSIQINDVNQKTAPSGSRVGLALKGVQAKEIQRGYILSTEEHTTDSLTLNCQLTKYASGFKTSDVLHLYTGLQSTPVRVKKIIQENAEVESTSGGDTCTCHLQAEKTIAHGNTDTLLLANLNEPKQRLLAGCTTTGDEQ